MAKKIATKKAAKKAATTKRAPTRSDWYGKKKSPKKTTIDKDFIDQEEARQYADPLCIQFTNLTSEVKHCELFGFGKNYRSENFGSDEGVRVENLQGHKYEEVLCYSAFNPFVLGKMAIHLSSCSGVKGLQFPSFAAGEKFKEEVAKYKFTYIIRNGNGIRYEKPLLFSWMSSDLSRIQQPTVEVYSENKINQESLISFILQPRDRLIITVFPCNQTSVFKK